ncbi:hypothetical protein Pcinc_040397, partial [Petrolisthes cinctipes]
MDVLGVFPHTQELWSCNKRLRNLHCLFVVHCVLPSINNNNNNNNINYYYYYYYYNINYTTTSTTTTTTSTTTTTTTTTSFGINWSCT